MLRGAPGKPNPTETRALMLQLEEKRKKMDVATGHGLARSQEMSIIRWLIWGLAKKENHHLQDHTPCDNEVEGDRVGAGANGAQNNWQRQLRTPDNNRLQPRQSLVMGYTQR